MARTALTAALLLALSGAAASGDPNPTGAVLEELVKKHGEGQRARITRGLEQVGRLWRPEDGDLAAFAREQFLADPASVDATFARFEANLEVLDGHLNVIQRDLRKPLDLDTGPLLPADALFGDMNPDDHLVDDLFASKLAFVALLNFPQSTLDERLASGATWSRRQWAEARLTGRVARRIPAAVKQEITRAESAGELYISEYNIWMHHLVGPKGERPFPKGLRLITHWNLRDELRGQYADKKGGLARQRMIVKVMERIVTQSIPAAVIDNPRVDWDPFANTVKATPAAELEADAPDRPVGPDATPEADVRYAKLLAIYRAHRAADAYAPTAPTALARTFEEAEVPEARTEALLTEILSSPMIKQVAAEIQKRLGRKLEPHDIWYAGFQARGKIPEAELDAETRKHYPTSQAFAADIPGILQRLGFAKEKADFVARHVVVDPSRGAGHAMESKLRGDEAHLRTRVEKEGMTYKGYNIAVHELGHNVEQVFSLYSVDHTLLAGVPVTAITEALAFVFQARDLELLGVAGPDPDAARLRALGNLWNCYELSGVALVEMRAWHWMYDHPDATPAQTRDAVVAIAREIWNKHYAPVLGGKDSVILGIYSHMLSTPLYLFNYALGLLISFQIEEQMDRAGAAKLGSEYERMTIEGKVTPDEWMRNATGAPLGTASLLRAAGEALKKPPR